MNEKNGPGFEDDDIGRLLRAAGPREQMPEALKESWAQLFQDELEQAQAKKSARRWRFAAAVAAVLVLAVGIGSMREEVAPGPVMRVVTTAGSSEVDGRPVQPGQLMRAGSVLSTGSDGRLAVTWAGYDLRLDTGGRATLEENGITLERGRLYVSDDYSGVKSHHLQVATSLVSIHDIGTQFTVVAHADSTEATVREGTIVIDTGSDALQTQAKNAQATRVVIDAHRQVSTQQVAASGGDWEWIYAVTPPHELDGESAYQFLQWSTRETGLELVFSDARAEYYARSTTLHGDFPVENPDRAVETVLATTDLVVERQGERLFLSLAD